MNNGFQLLSWIQSIFISIFGVFLVSFPFSFTPVGTGLDFIPTSFPFLSPSEYTVARNTDFCFLLDTSIKNFHCNIIWYTSHWSTHEYKMIQKKSCLIIFESFWNKSLLRFNFASYIKIRHCLHLPDNNYISLWTEKRFRDNFSTSCIHMISIYGMFYILVNYIYIE